MNNSFTFVLILFIKQKSGADKAVVVIEEISITKRKHECHFYQGQLKSKARPGSQKNLKSKTYQVLFKVIRD